MAKQDPAHEVNFDGLVGPTYNHAATAPGGPGNLASAFSRGRPSNPRAAALEGLKKAKTVMRLGIRQAVLPPLVRPNLARLFRMGLIKDKALLHADDFDALARHLADRAAAAPHLLAAAFSGSSIWAANSATVSPSPDTDDQRVHFTPANQSRSYHRSQEAEETFGLLTQVFGDSEHFVCHDPLPSTYQIGDEGAANHLRLTTRHGTRGMNVFVYGRGGFEEPAAGQKYFPRQTLEASRAVARLHGLDASSTYYVCQNPDAIDAGVFHNDVIATANLDVLFYHELAFADPVRAVSDLKEGFRALTKGKAALRTIEVSKEDISLGDAATSYLFNSQLLTDRAGKMVLIAPRHCQYVDSVRRCLDRIKERSGGTISRHEFIDVPSSMRNGGGPACLRLRVVLTPAQQNAINGRVMLDDELLRELTDLVEADYPTEVDERTFVDASFLKTCFDIARNIYKILGLKPAGIP
jgi:succinylarginine dihydrolase